MPNPAVERVGVILVHGIGEQRRFQRLDWQQRVAGDARGGGNVVADQPVRKADQIQRQGRTPSLTFWPAEVTVSRPMFKNI